MRSPKISDNRKRVGIHLCSCKTLAYLEVFPLNRHVGLLLGVEAERISVAFEGRFQPVAIGVHVGQGEGRGLHLDRVRPFRLARHVKLRRKDQLERELMMHSLEASEKKWG